MADRPCTPVPSRRALLAITTLPSLVPIVAMVPPPGPAQRYGFRAFVEEIAALHPNGRAVAVKALVVGAEPELLQGVSLYVRDHPERAPILYSK